MRGLLSIFMLLTAVLAVTHAYRSPIPIPLPNQPGFPSFPGQGPFNPIIPFPRFRRSPADNEKGKITIEGRKDGSKTSYGIDVDRKIWGNKHGSIGINAGVNKNPNEKPQSHIGINGKFHFG